MSVIFTLIFVQILSCHLMIKADQVDEYIKMINEGTERAKNYKLPVNNDDLYPKTLSSVVQEFGFYDYIVVGAGSAGAIVAKRLADAEKKTLLIEAGGEETPYSNILALWKNTAFSEQNWGYKTKPQKHICQAMINKQCWYHRGKSLGGTSAINGMIYARGNALDQAKWSDYGITGWTWKQVLPFYKKLENYSLVYGDPGYHGYKGPVPIIYNSPSSWLIRYLLQAYAEIGDVTEDLYGERYMAMGKTHYNKKNGRRASTNQCYLQSPSDYLTILTEAYVYKVLVQNSQAVGVEFTKDKIRYRAKSSFEVIISAGTTNTPQILMLSGIGPRQELEKHKIPVIADLPVGKHFQDHFSLNMDFQANFPFTQKSLEQDVWDLVSSGTGRLSNSENLAFAHVSTLPHITHYPDIELIFNSEKTPYGAEVNIGNLNEEALTIMGKAMSHITKNYTFLINIILLHPKSEGEITLQSNNPRDFPLIDSLTSFDPEDMNTIYRGVKRTLSLLETGVFKKLEVSSIEMIFPACKKHKFGSEASWRCYIRHGTFAAWHSVGSCRMGRAGESVLDSKLRVRGIKSLRVIDLSAVPMPNSGHPHAVAMMVGEKGADIVLKDHF